MSRTRATESRRCMPRSGAVVWHDVECAAYGADLSLWRELAAAGGGPVLDLGCGSGRVALDLAAAGHTVVGLDSDPDLVQALRARARERGLPATATAGDVRSFELGRRFPLAVAAMQVVQLLGGPAGRAAFLRSAAAHLEPGGLLAVALADPLEGVPAVEVEPPRPDVREEAGWVFQSRPLRVRELDGGAGLAVDRLRQAVSPTGELEESLATVELDAVEPRPLEAEARTEGYAVEARRHVPATEAYVSSAVCMLRHPGGQA